MGIQSAVLEVGGLDWATSAAVVEQTLLRRPGVLAVEASFVSQTANVTYDPDRTDIAQLSGWVRDCGYHCAGQSVPAHVCDPMAEAGTVGHVGGHVGGHDDEHRGGHDDGHDDGHGGASSMDEMIRDMRNRFLVAVVFSVPILLWSPIGREVLGFSAAAPFGLRDDVFSLLLSLPVIFYSAWIFFAGAFRALRARTLDMMVLVAVGVGTGWLYSVVVTLTGGGEVFYEAATVLTSFVLLGHWFEMRARGGANDAVRALLELAPSVAVVLRQGEAFDIPTAEVQVGDLLLVRPGSKVPVDAVVEDGESEVDESMVTGESMPVAKSPGAEVIGASINTTGTLRARATKVGGDTALAQIVAMVQEAQNSRAPGQRLADRAAFWLVLVALIAGSATFLVWLASGASVQTAMLYAITVVVITCPDALGLATPTAIMVGTGLGARRGVLFKNASALEASARIDTVVMDKTGTLTRGEPEVTDVIAEGITEDEMLALAAAVERESEHPLARAIADIAAGRGVPVLTAGEFRNVPGHGASARVQSRRVVVGNRRLMTAEKVDLGSLAGRRDQLAGTGRTAVLVAVDGRAVGVIALADAVRPTAAAAVEALQDMGIRVVMLTGDNEATARRIGDQLGIDTVIAEVLPGDKADRIAELQRAGRRVAMVGDGVNDAPALALADLGIAIGAGTDVAIETADVVLMRSDPLDVAAALRIGRGTLRKMRQNLGWAIGYNAIALPIAAGVFVPAFGLVLRPEIAALSMSGSSLIVAVNALLLKRLKVPGPAPSPIPSTSAAAIGGQQAHWATTFETNPDMYGTDPSAPGLAAAEMFMAAGVGSVLELGAGQGRDTLYLARQGLQVIALDYATGAVETLAAASRAAGLADLVNVARHDLREPLPLRDGSVDASYSHMLFSMALTTGELERLVGELHRVLRPGGLVVYTARTTADAHYGAGISRGDDMYEHGGFIVHFFDRALIDRLAAGFELLDVTSFTEGELPRRLARVAMRVPSR